MMMMMMMMIIVVMMDICSICVTLSLLLLNLYKDDISDKSFRIRGMVISRERSGQT
jgi:hypothetical protein